MISYTILQSLPQLVIRKSAAYVLDVHWSVGHQRLGNHRDLLLLLGVTRMSVGLQLPEIPLFLKV